MKILVAVDSSPASTLAAREAAGRPWPAGTSVRVITVIEPLYGWAAPNLEEALQRYGEHTVEEAAEYFKHAGLQTVTAVLCGDPKTVVVQETADPSVDWVVVGSHNTTSIIHFLLGSVSRAVARLAASSVEIVRANPAPGPLKILLATDGSEWSRAAARSIAQRPWLPGATFRILSVVEPSVPLFQPPYFNAALMEDLRGKDMQRAQAAVSEAEKLLFEAGIEASSTVAVPAATPKELIVSEAKEWGASLIVVGSHGRRGMNRLLLGSVSEAVAFHAHCSVEIIRIR